MTTFEHVLEGCAPVPLAGYLKALGVFRLVAEQADEHARGFWRDERFVLRTILTEDEVVRFFSDTCEPSPIISPWNGRAGFLEGEVEDSDEESSRTGAELIRRYEGAGDRFKKLREAAEIYRRSEIIMKLDKARAEAKSLQHKQRKKKISEEERKKLKDLEGLIKVYRSSAIIFLRAEAQDWAIGWFDACQRIAQKRTVFPLLGSGGLDGSRDFGVSFGLALADLFDINAGKALNGTATRIRESLGFGLVASLPLGNLGQYEPGGAGENTTCGFVGKQPLNPADFVLLLEGAILFSGTTTRRLGSNETRHSFPFTVDALTAGSGAAARNDDQNFAEFWAPIWTRPVSLGELRAFLAEGRATANGKSTQDGLDFAVAVGTLGSQRGVFAYQRFGLLQREPRNPKKATPLGRIRVRENPRASLISELDAGGWLSRAHQALRDKNAPASLGAIGRRLDEALFRLASDGSPEAVQEALIAFGVLMLEAGRRPKLRQTDKGAPPLPPPPCLSREWPAAADDGSHEFALAAALAGLDATAEDVRLPFRCHLAPLVTARHHDSWDDKTASKVRAVWSGRDLLRDMAAVLERRLLEAQRCNFVDRQKQAELPLRSRRTAPLAAVAAFLGGRTADHRIAALAAGLAWAWARAHGTPSAGAEREDALPFAYVTLKPLLAPDGVGPKTGEKRLLDPLPLVRLIRAGRVDHAITRGQRMARGAGLATPFAQLDPASPADPSRLAAALLFPVAPMALERLTDRAYPAFTKDEEDSDAA